MPSSQYYLEAKTTVVEGAPPVSPRVPRAITASQSWENAKQNNPYLIYKKSYYLEDWSRSRAG